MKDKTLPWLTCHNYSKASKKNNQMSNQQIRHPNSESPEFHFETFPDNHESKFPVVFVLDVSSSMRGRGIIELNKGLQMFESFFIDDPVAHASLEVSIVTFSTYAQVIREFSPLGNLSFPKLSAGGRTNLAAGVEMGIHLIQARKQIYKLAGIQYYRPYILLISDGAPWPDKCVNRISKAIKTGVKDGAFVFQAFGAGNACMKVLGQISHKDFPPQILDGHNYSKFFHLLAPSLSAIISKSVAHKPILLKTHNHPPFV